MMDWTDRHCRFFHRLLTRHALLYTEMITTGAVPHGEAVLCAECAGLQDYARKRLASCTYGPGKPTCVNCPIHCYGRRQREAMRAVMRYAGPRMLWRHPLLAVAHLIDGRRPAPPRPNSQAAAQDQDPASAPPR